MHATPLRLPAVTDHLPPGTRMGPIHLRVRDLDRALDFWKGLLGMRALRRAGETVELGADAPVVRLTGDPRAPPRPPHAPGLYHVAILLPGREHLARFVEHASAFRIPLQGGADHLVSEALYLGDPEGNGIELYADRPAAEWEYREGQLQMGTAPLDIEDLLSQAGTDAWDGTPAGTRVGHVHLQVADVPAAAAFYRDAVGFEPTATMGDQAVFLSAGGYHHHLGANSWASRGQALPPENAAGLVAYEIHVPDADALGQAEARLAAHGASREADAVTLRDPMSGARLRIAVA